MGCDQCVPLSPAVFQDFNPRSPNGLRPVTRGHGNVIMIFQSTQPEWAATTPAAKVCAASHDFNPRSPNGLRHGACPPMRRKKGYFNPRSPNGLRPCVMLRGRVAWIFQSTQPEWAATDGVLLGLTYLKISIHAARMGCDGGKRIVPGSINISIHAARMGCDHASQFVCSAINYFNPRSPNGLRL